MNAQIHDIISIHDVHIPFYSLSFLFYCVYFILTTKQTPIEILSPVLNISQII